MLEKIVEVLIKQFLKPRTKKERSEDDVKEKIVFLHECLLDCHNSYLNYKDNPNELTQQKWKRDVYKLSYILDLTGLSLSTFSPETFNYIQIYVLHESISHFDKKLDEQSKELRKNIFRLDMLRTAEITENHDKEFEDAAARLREFIKDNLTLGEVFQAKEAFKKGGVFDYLFSYFPE